MRRYKELGLILISTFIAYFVQAQNMVLVGKQVLNDSKNVKLIATPVYITHSYVIEKVVGDTTGFWIENSQGQAIVSFKHSKDAIGYVLPKGKYRVLPNLPPKKKQAQIKVFLVPKRKK